MDIVVKKDFSPSEEKQASLARAQFRKPQATSFVSNVLNVADAGNTVVLCDDHVKQFATPAVLSKYGYRRADAVPTSLGMYPYVMGNCDYCQVHTRCTMFIHLSLYEKVWRTKEQRRRDHEYGAICRG